MFGVKIIVRGVPTREVTPIEDAILSVLKEADPSWAISLIVLEDGTWRLSGQPADGQGVRVDLTSDEHSPEAIREIVFGWYEHCREARL